MAMGSSLKLRVDLLFMLSLFRDLFLLRLLYARRFWKFSRWLSISLLTTVSLFSLTSCILSNSLVVDDESRKVSAYSSLALREKSGSCSSVFMGSVSSYIAISLTSCSLLGLLYGVGSFPTFVSSSTILGWIFYGCG